MFQTLNIHARCWAFVALLAVAAGAAISGCSHEDYYCDNTGCFYCDGVGCRSATPPSRATCQGNWSCTTGQVCTSAGCATTCSTDSDCAQGWVCRGGGGDAGTNTGLCVAPTETTPTPNPGSCHTNTDCPNGLVCLSGTCHMSTDPACTMDSQCPTGDVCVSGRCTASTNTCQFDNQCGPNRLCVNSQCVAVCGGAGSPSCPTGETCMTAGGVSYCAQQPSTSTCTVDTDCGSGKHCLNGTCYQACTAGTSTCSTGYYCSDDGVCVIDTRPAPFCDASHPCFSGSTCVDGVCRVPCSTNTQCTMTDVSYRTCGTIPWEPGTTTTYCLTADESNPTCSRASQCAMGQSCIDAVCH